jgi:hypothetical protein
MEVFENASQRIVLSHSQSHPNNESDHDARNSGNRGNLRAREISVHQF